MSDINIHGVPNAPGGYNLTGKKVMVHDPAAPLSTSTVLFDADDLGSGGGSADRFGIEDNVGVQDRNVDMEQHSFIMSNAVEIFIYTQNSDISDSDSNSSLDLVGSGTSNRRAALTAYQKQTDSIVKSGQIEITANDGTTDHAFAKFIFSKTDGNVIEIITPQVGPGIFFRVLPISVNGNFADAAGNITVAATGGTGYAAPIWKVDDGDMTAGQFTFTSAALIGATEMNFIIVNKVIEFIDDDFSFNSGTGEITRTNPWVAGDKMITPHKPA